MQHRLSICLNLSVISNLAKLTFATPSVTIAKNLSEPISTKIVQFADKEILQYVFLQINFLKHINIVDGQMYI